MGNNLKISSRELSSSSTYVTTKNLLGVLSKVSWIRSPDASIVHVEKCELMNVRMWISISNTTLNHELQILESIDAEAGCHTFPKKRERAHKKAHFLFLIGYDDAWVLHELDTRTSSKFCLSIICSAYGDSQWMSDQFTSLFNEHRSHMKWLHWILWTPPSKGHR